jgi:DNA-binding GntR family transcriptional regulator
MPSRTVLVLDAIKHAILTGELRPGQSLVETDLAGLLGVSKTPVREALKTLAGAGLVTMSPYKGATVRTVDDELVRSVYDVRLLLEPEALRRSVGRGGDWRGAQQALDQSARASDPAERSLANRDFHRGLYAGCGNALLIRVLDDLRDQTALVSAAAWLRTPAPDGPPSQHPPSQQPLNQHLPSQHPLNQGGPSQGTPAWRSEAAEHEAAEHEAILAAATAGNASTAARLLTDHIRSFLNRNFPSLGGIDGT